MNPCISPEYRAHRAPDLPVDEPQPEPQPVHPHHPNAPVPQDDPVPDHNPSAPRATLRL